MIPSTTLKVLTLIIYVLAIANVANVMVIQKDVYLSSVGDGIVLNYFGSDEVYVLTSQLPPESFDVRVGNTSKEGIYSGVIYVRVTKQLIDSTYKYLVALYSVSPFTANITIVSGGRYSTETINCPPNVTIQLTFNLLNNFTGSVKTLPQVPIYLSTPIWSLAVLALTTSLFITSAVLDVRDYSRIKKDRWGVQESIAVIVRYLLYSSLISFILSTILTIGTSIYMSITYKTTSFEFSWLLTPFIALLVSALAYQICKWKGWYDVVDEE